MAPETAEEEKVTMHPYPGDSHLEMLQKQLEDDMGEGDDDAQKTDDSDDVQQAEPVDDDKEKEETEEEVTDDDADSDATDEGEDEDDDDEFIEEVISDLPEDQQEAARSDKNYWKALKEQRKKYKEEIAEAKKDSAPTTTSADAGLTLDFASETGLADGAGRLAEGEVPATQQTQAPTSVDPNEVFKALAECNDGQRDQLLKPRCEAVIDEMTPQEILGVVKTAENGGFGDYSQDVENLASKALVKSNAMQGQRESDKQAVAAFTAQRNKAIEEVKQIEGIEDPESDNSKAYHASLNELNRVFPDFWHIYSTAPLAVKRFMELQQTAGSAKELTVLRKENKELKKRLGDEQSPQKSKRGGVDPNRPMSADEQLSADLKAGGMAHLDRDSKG